ncbi:hypothetical protein EDM76_04060 [bacterium]|nr:MAG: hypothetical protein EDM76_04060 [bacterium]MCL4232331.1 hypothetical protein [Dehalococcoidia bacterium]
MSQLKKMIARLGRPQNAGIGFGPVSREKPKALLLAALAPDAGTARQLLEAGADVAIACAADAQGVRSVIEGLAGGKVIAGAWVSAIDGAGAEALRSAGCDFVISTVEGTAADAVDPDQMGVVVAVDNRLDDTTLRAMAPLGLDGLFVERSPGNMNLAAQLDLVRLATLSGTPLLVTASADVTVAELRVLRDSGVAAVVLPESAATGEVKALAERLRTVPARKPKREGQDIALVPSMASGSGDHEPDEEEEEE